MTRIEENLLAQTNLMERFECQTERRLQAVEAGADCREAEWAEFRVTVTRVLDLLERFVSGKSGSNGH
ncbi:MAG: hypothetical protein ACRD3T_06100 [Terriglobia bacterium]